jgi:hypothetical protein
MLISIKLDEYSALLSEMLAVIPESNREVFVPRIEKLKSVLSDPVPSGTPVFYSECPDCGSPPRRFSENKTDQ